MQNNDKEIIQKAYGNVINKFHELIYFGKAKEFDEDRKSKRIIQFLLSHMSMVIYKLIFLKAVRTGDWELHISSLRNFMKYFFSHDKENYARLMLLYISDMEKLKVQDNDIYEEFIEGDWVVNKNEDAAFCDLGADHALEQINRQMKV